MEPKFTNIMQLGIPSSVSMPEGWIMQVFITGENPLPSTDLFWAHFDDQPIEGLTIDIEGTGLVGFLKALPADGAKLFVEFEGEDPIDTGLTFSTDPNA